MLIDNGARRHARSDDGVSLDPSQIVMGLHWDPPQEDAAPDDLDALCVLLDAQGGVVEVIHPDHPRNLDGSVVHTGDSRTGASAWDDERIFVFLEALPAAVTELAFVVASATGRSLNEVRGAAFHVTDHVTEREIVCRELTAFDRTAHCVASLHRGRDGWRICTAATRDCGEFLDEVLLRIGNGKTAEARDGARRS